MTSTVQSYFETLLRYQLSVTFCGAAVLKVMDQKTIIKRRWSYKVCIMHQSILPAPSDPRPPSQAIAGHLPALSVPGVGHLQILYCPGAGHLPTPGPFLSFWHARGFLSEYNYTEDFTGKESRLAHLSRTGKIEEVCKGMFLILCMHFFIAYRARIT